MPPSVSFIRLPHRLSAPGRHTHVTRSTRWLAGGHPRQAYRPMTPECEEEGGRRRNFSRRLRRRFPSRTLLVFSRPTLTALPRKGDCPRRLTRSRRPALRFYRSDRFRYAEAEPRKVRPSTGRPCIARGDPKREQQVPNARCATESLAPHPPLPPHARFRNLTCGTRHTRSFRSRRAKSLFVFRSRWRPDFQLKPRRPLRRSSRR